MGTAPPVEEVDRPFHQQDRDGLLPPQHRAEAPGTRSLGEMTAHLRASWSSASSTLKTFLADAHAIPFAGHTVTGDDHLAGGVHLDAASIKPSERAERSFLPDIGGGVYRMSDHWHHDVRHLQGTVHYKTYKYAVLATRILTGTLSPLQAGIFIGTAALPIIDARFPAASEGARHTLMAASIVADPFAFAAGSLALVAVRLAMQQAPAERRAFWQCMTFLLSRQLSSHALAAS